MHDVRFTRKNNSKIGIVEFIINDVVIATATYSDYTKSVTWSERAVTFDISIDDLEDWNREIDHWIGMLSETFDLRFIYTNTVTYETEIKQQNGVSTIEVSTKYKTMPKFTSKWSNNTNLIHFSIRPEIIMPLGEFISYINLHKNLVSCVRNFIEA